MSDMVREIVYPTFVFVLIASVWALGWEKSHSDQMERGFWAPITPNPWIDAAPEEPSGQAVTSTFDFGDD